MKKQKQILGIIISIIIVLLTVVTVIICYIDKSKLAYMVIMNTILAIGAIIILYRYIIKSLDRTNETLSEYYAVTNRLNESESHIKNLTSEFNLLQSEYNDLKDINLNMSDIFDINQCMLAIRKYRIPKYHIDITTKKVTVLCDMRTYTKMSISKEILPNMVYHITGTNVVFGENNKQEEGDK